MNDRAQPKKHTTERKRLAARLWRMRAILKTIPKDTHPALLPKFRMEAFRMSALGKRALATVVFSWTPRPSQISANSQKPGRARRNLLRTLEEAGARVPRGRLSNPTVLR